MNALTKATLRMEHEDDPRREIIAAIGDIAGIEVMHNQVLIALYRRPDKTKGGIFLSDVTRKEDEYQGKVGLVLKKGPLAFVDDAHSKFGGQDVAVGEWIGIRPGDGWPVALMGTEGKVECRMVEDVHIKMRLSAPDDIH